LSVQECTAHCPGDQRLAGGCKVLPWRLASGASAAWSGCSTAMYEGLRAFWEAPVSSEVCPQVRAAHDGGHWPPLPVGPAEGPVG
jgi:hypothetical protein